MDALSAHTAQLPYIHLGDPGRLIGTNTVDCMKAGSKKTTVPDTEAPGPNG